ncbi:MAG: Asp-tRNA(Asn)/Glu-tRNA(Gln) amidotransferase subunit GatC [Candidatus Omnitrophota bacterium]|jgi:aspartyl-tRNA(Asn)/glutamyl-tRNA(Gln) amidotransferase subunit C|nr:MAG: Asp-tRNA(Asn)/Glu-tRNA(Gln) amidotransferase subunit GatC [Candidatus Omnitrophota bacterium]
MAKSNQITKDTVAYLAHLARIELKNDELDKLSGQLEDILEFINKLKNLNTRDVSPTSHILPISNVLRKDTVVPSLPAKKALTNAPAEQEGFFSVPKIIE